MTWLRANWRGLALGAAVFGAALAASSSVVGLAWDDGVYVAAGQALAHGHGYVLANRVGDQAVPLYPAGYPLLVALAWIVAGTQAATFALLAALSAACVSGAVFLWWRILRRETSDGTAALLVAVPALSYATLLTGELRMADAPYALLVAVAAGLWRRAPASRGARAPREALAASGVPVLPVAPATSEALGSSGAPASRGAPAASGEPASRGSLAAVVLVGALAVPLRTAGVVLPLAIALLLVARRRWAPVLAVVAASALLVALLQLLLRPPEPAYGDVVRAAWTSGGAGLDILRANLGRDLWTSVAALLAPPLVYSAAVQRLAQGAGVWHIAYVLAIAAVCLAVVVGGWCRLRKERWQVGDLVLVGAVTLVFVMPLGMLPRFLVPVGPVLALWAWEGVSAAGAQWRLAARAVLVVVLALTAVEAARHVLRQPRVLRERATAYAAAGRAARAWLGRGGLISAEFPETLWFEAGLRSVSVTSPLENEETALVGLEAARRRLDPIARGCLLDTRTFEASRELHDEYVGRSGAAELAGLDANYVRVVCWTS